MGWLGRLAQWGGRDREDTREQEDEMTQYSLETARFVTLWLHLVLQLVTSLAMSRRVFLGRLVQEVRLKLEHIALEELGGLAQVGDLICSRNTVTDRSVGEQHWTTPSSRRWRQTAQVDLG